jgi:phosphate transport system permease protein
MEGSVLLSAQTSPLQAFIDRRYPRRKLKSLVACVALGLCAGVALIPLFSVFVHVVSAGFPALNGSLFTELPRPVGEVGGGMANAVVGTLILLLMGSVLGIPWGIAAGLYLSEYGRGRFADLVRFGVDLLGSVPSIIIGLFAYALMVIPMHGFSAIAGSVALAIIMVPTVARSTEEILRLVPHHLREAGLALGLPRWKVILHIVLRGSLRSLSTGIMLAIARVAGETAPLLFTAFNNRFWPQGLTQPTSSLPVQIYTYSISPYKDWHQKAWAGALILVLLVFTMNLLTRAALRPTQRRRA